MYDLWMRKDTYMTSKFVMLAIMLALGAGAVNAQNPLTDWSTPPCSKGGLNPPGTATVSCSSWGTCPADAPFVRILASASAWGISCQFYYHIYASANVNFRGAEVFASSSGSYQGGNGDYQIEKSCYGYSFESSGWSIPLC